jgi:radical SAM protein with 4Fe4S-binding SPASM domain
VSDGYMRPEPLKDAAFLERLRRRGTPLGFDLEITARCNNDCRHCFINLPAGDAAARAGELPPEDFVRIAREAVDLGCVWCLVTGGEPLLREDFAAIYLALRRTGLLVSVFTNACLVREEHVALFREHPPRDVEVTVYGATEATYERVTRRPGSYRAFRRGVELLLEGGVKVRFKAVALRSNVDELPEIARFCRERTRDYFRFDAMLHLRYDRDEARNALIREERLPPERIAALDREDEERWATLERTRDAIAVAPDAEDRGRLFRCGVRSGNFAVSHDGVYRPCASLWHPDYTSDLRRVSVAEAWRKGAASIAAARTDDPGFRETCGSCSIGNLCLGCPAHLDLETQHLDGVVPYFCAVAMARAALLGIDGELPD